MNPKLQASLLLPFLAGVLSAQDLRLDADVTSGQLTARIDGAEDGALVVLVVGLRKAPCALPGGKLLGVELDAAATITIADRAGTTTVLARLPRGTGKIDCYLQAVAISPKLPLDAPDAISVSTVATVHSAGS